MSEESTFYVNESLKLIKELKDVKGYISEELKEVKVLVEKSDINLNKAITDTFGKIEEGDPRKGYITFEMFIECIRIINAAGQAKAASILDGGI